jgi:hypothetical protein
MKILPQEQIQRLNHIINTIDTYSSMNPEKLGTQPGPDQWSLLEVVEHLNHSYALYRPRIDELLQELPDLKEPKEHFRSGGIKGWLIHSYRPKNGKRSFKMKTFSNLEPAVKAEQQNEEKQKATFNAFFDHMNHLKESILASRTKDCRKGKLDSAVGSMLRFTIPEAVEFNLNHMDRHLIQMEETLERIR